MRTPEGVRRRPASTRAGDGRTAGAGAARELWQPVEATFVDGVSILSISPDHFEAGVPQDIVVKVSYELLSREDGQISLSVSEGDSASRRRIGTQRVRIGQGETEVRARFRPVGIAGLPLARILVSLNEFPSGPVSTPLATDEDTITISGEAAVDAPTADSGPAQRFSQDLGLVDTPWGAMRSFQSMRPAATPPPLYPLHEKMAGITGLVQCASYVDEAGIVLEVQVVASSGNENLDHAATAALQQWKYEPFGEEGAPIRFVTFQPIRFALEEF